MKYLTFLIKGLALSAIIILSGCGGGGKAPIDSNTTASSTEYIDKTSLSKTETGKISVYPKKREYNSILAETRVEDEAGIENITLYCIDAYKYYEEHKLKIVQKSSKNYNPAETKIEFYQHNFINLSPGKSYIIKAVATTEAGKLAQQITTATLPIPYPGIDVDVGNYKFYHVTQALYTFNFTPTFVKKIRIDEYDGDGGLFDVALIDMSGNVLPVQLNIVSSGDDVNKVHILTNPNPNTKVKQITIRTHTNLGGMWQINSIKLNP